MKAAIAFLLSLVISHAAFAVTLPAAIDKQLPPGFVVLTSEEGDLNADGHVDDIVVLAKQDEQSLYEKTGSQTSRPLLIFMGQGHDAYRLAARNDDVVPSLCCQCDPFDPQNDPDQGIVVKGAFFTIQSGIACGQHWQDYLTFRYDRKTSQFLFHRETYQSWSLNPDPNGDALVSDGLVVDRESFSHPKPFTHYKPNP